MASAVSSDLFVRRRSGPPDQAHDERDHEDDEEQHEEDLGDPRRARGDAAESEDGRDQGDDEEDQGPSQHGRFPPLTGRTDSVREMMKKGQRHTWEEFTWMSAPLVAYCTKQC